MLVRLYLSIRGLIGVCCLLILYLPVYARGRDLDIYINVWNGIPHVDGATMRSYTDYPFFSGPTALSPSSSLPSSPSSGSPDFWCI